MFYMKQKYKNFYIGQKNLKFPEISMEKKRA